MEYECGPLLLQSQDKIRMMDFLSDVLEFDVDCLSDSVHRGPLNLKLFESTIERSESKLPNNNVIFSFKAKSENELKEIMSKYNFFLYRKSNQHDVLEKLDLVQNETTKILTIIDIDQRMWRFEFESSLGL